MPEFSRLFYQYSVVVEVTKTIQTESVISSILNHSVSIRLPRLLRTQHELIDKCKVLNKIIKTMSQQPASGIE